MWVPLYRHILYKPKRRSAITDSVGKQRYNISSYLREWQTKRGVSSLNGTEGTFDRDRRGELTSPPASTSSARAHTNTHTHGAYYNAIKRYGLAAPLDEVSGSHERSRQDCPSSHATVALFSAQRPIDPVHRAYASFLFFDERERSRLRTQSRSGGIKSLSPYPFIAIGASFVSRCW